MCNLKNPMQPPVAFIWGPSFAVLKLNSGKGRSPVTCHLQVAQSQNPELFHLPLFRTGNS